MAVSLNKPFKTQLHKRMWTIVYKNGGGGEGEISLTTECIMIKFKCMDSISEELIKKLSNATE